MDLYPDGMSLKLATWNVAWPDSVRRRLAIRKHTNDVSADVWVLTETHDEFSPGDDFTSVSSTAGGDGNDKPQHRWVSIWSRYLLERIETKDKQRTAAARIHPPTGAPFLVYGTVLPWIGSAWGKHPSAGGVAFREALAVQTADWIRLRRSHPNDEFFVLGDFNQDLVRVAPRYYGSRANRTGLEAALKQADLFCLTGSDRDPVRLSSPPCATIDHICCRRDSRWLAAPAARWPDTREPEKWLSDHFGLSIVFERT